MKEGIHPGYNEAVAATCSCGNSFKVGSTAKEISVEVCSNCHPFYTGKQKLVDAAGRVDKFRQRQEETAKLKSTVKQSSQKKESGKKRGPKVTKLG